MVGDLFYLVEGPSGPVRGEGSAYQRIYEIVSLLTADYQLNVRTSTNTGYTGSFRYSPCPTLLLIHGDTMKDVQLVPF
jgi:hypothetical protein